MAPSTQRTLRIVDKQSYDKQHFFPQSTLELSPLTPGHVRIQPTMLGLASYNLSYCAMGELLHWYDAYPLLKTAETMTTADGKGSSALPEEFRDAARYAVPVGWGYAEVLESRVDGLREGKRVYGMLPMCDVVVDLKLVEARDTRGTHWIEVSEHRGEMMALYKRYIVVDEDYGEEVPEDFREWRCAAFTVWQCGYLLNRYCFSARQDE